MRFDVEANDNALLATTSMTKEISGFTNTIKNAINRTGFGFVFSSDNAQYKGRNVKNITVYKARNLLSNGNEFEPIYKTLVVTYIERMLRFYSGDFKQDKILTFFSNNPNSQKSRWDADRQYVNSILQDGDELDFSIDEKNGVCDVLVTFANTTKNLKVQLVHHRGKLVKVLMRPAMGSQVVIVRNWYRIIPQIMELRVVVLPYKILLIRRHKNIMPNIIHMKEQ